MIYWQRRNWRYGVENLPSWACEGLHAARGVEFLRNNDWEELVAAMIKLLALLGVLAAVNAAAQAPTEERILPGGNPVAQGQQRLGFLNREREAAEARMKRAELELLEAQDMEGTAQKRLDVAKKQRESAGGTLDRARQELAVARKAYEQESFEFERMLKGSLPSDARKAGAKK